MESNIKSSGQQANQTEKVLIVGGGVIGIASAHYLTELGYAVTVIDQGEIGGGSSYGNCGYICPSHMLPLAEPGMVKTGLKSLLNPQAAFRIKPQLRFALYRWLYQFARRCNHQQMLEGAFHLKSILEDSRQEFELLLTGTALQAQWKKTGLFYVLKSAQGVEDFLVTDHILSDHFGLKARFIDGSELIEFDPALKPGLAGGFLYDNDASLEPSEFVTNWANSLVNKGVQLIEHCQLTQVKKAGKMLVSIETTKGEMTADHFVFATGAWSSLLASELGCRIPVEPCKGYSVTTDRPAVCPKIPMLFPEHRVGVTPFDDTFRLGSMMEFSGFDTQIPSSRIEQLYQSAEPYLRSSFDTTNEKPWFGWRPMTWDSLPIIGHVPKFNNALLATGHSMLGVTLAPATGKLVAALVAGQQPDIDPTPFSPSRF